MSSNRPSSQFLLNDVGIRKAQVVDTTVNTHTSAAPGSTLLDLAAGKLCETLACVLDLESSKQRSQITQTWLCLDENLCHMLLRTLANKKLLGKHTLLYFSDPQDCSVSVLNVGPSTNIADADVMVLSKHPLRELYLSDCRLLTGEFLRTMNATGMDTIIMKDCAGLMSSHLISLNRFTNLQSLNLDNAKITTKTLAELSGLRHLKSLSLAGVLCVNNSAMTIISKSSYAHSLMSLDLSRTNITVECAPMLNILSKLRTLSLIGLSRLEGEFFFNSLVLSHPLLENVSLCGTSIDQFSIRFLQYHCAHLKFLGLCNVPLSSPTCIQSQHNLVVTGLFTLPSVVAMVQHHQNDTDLTHQALQFLYNLYRANPPTEDTAGALECVYKVVSLHRNQLFILMAASVPIYHLTRPQVKNQCSRLRKQLLDLLVEIFGDHADWYPLQKNICLTLCNFDVHTELGSHLNTIPKLLLAAAIRHAHVDRGGVLQRVAVGLTGSWVCLGVVHKIKLGSLGIVSQLLQLIRLGVDEDLAMGPVVEAAWGALWNITDESPENCVLFFEASGLETITTALKELTLGPENASLIRNMLGLVGNIAEVHSLRHHLLNDDLLLILTDLLPRDKEFGDIEVVYNAAGIVAHLCSEGEDIWRRYMVTVSHAQTVHVLLQSVRTWDIRMERTIKYRSLVPIVELANKQCPSAQAWALWALTNLCSVYPSRYIPLLENTHGIASLCHLRNSSCAYVNFLASILNNLLHGAGRSLVPAKQLQW
eukprot:CFRG0572T1